MINKNTSNLKVSFFVIIALVLLLILVLFVFFLKIGWEFNSLQTAKRTLEMPTVVQSDPLITPTGPIVPPIESVDPVLGQADAPLTIIYFSDFACPYCKRMSEIFFRILKDYDGKVKLVWKDLLSTPNSLALHKAARCAQLQNSFWEYNKKLLEFKPTSGSLVEQLTGYAADLGLDTASFLQCMGDPAIEGVIFASTNQAINLGLSNTPAYFIGGEYYDGFMDYDDIKTIIEKKLGLEAESKEN